MKKFSNIMRLVFGLVGATIGLFLELVIDGGVTSYLPLFVVIILSTVVFFLPKKWRLNKKTVWAYLIFSFVVIGLSIFDGFITKDFDWLSVSFFGSWFLFGVYWWLIFRERR